MTPLTIRLKSYKNRATKLMLELLYYLHQNNFNHLDSDNNEFNVVILMYHGVVKEKASKFNYRHISIHDFEVQLKILKKHCNVVSINDIFMSKLSKNKLNVALTFDDGFRNNYLYAKPLLEKYKLPASFYITGSADSDFEWLWPDFLDIMARHVTNNVNIDGRTFVSNSKYFYDVKNSDRLSDIIRYEKPSNEYKELVYESFHRWSPNMYRSDYLDYWELMNNEEIELLSQNPLFTIGCHGYFHNNLGSLKTKDAVQELIKSKNYLETLINSQVNEIAYPDGSYSKDLLEEAKKIGFPFQLGVTPRFKESTSSYCPLFRYGIYSFEHPRTQLVKMSRETIKFKKL